MKKIIAENIADENKIAEGNILNAKEALALIGEQEFLDKIYHFSYSRCHTSHEAEDLCSEIIVKVLAAVQRAQGITHFYAFVWTIAHRVYADYCERRRKSAEQISLENLDFNNLQHMQNEIDDLIEEAVQKKQLQKIMGTIAFLSKGYRDVMVLYYLDGYKVEEIASMLNLSVTTVKQRLFSARNSVRKEVEEVSNRNLSLKPVQMDFYGDGNPIGNNPAAKLERTLSQNLLYLCKNKAKTAKELSEELCVPMIYIEEELDIQCHGENGTYGTLRKLENGKYITNILQVEMEEFRAACGIYEKYLPEYCAMLKRKIEQKKEEILAFPYLSPQRDLKLILWQLLNFHSWTGKIWELICNRYFSDVVPNKREYSVAAIVRKGVDIPDEDIDGCDGIEAADVGGYRYVYVRNLYNKYMDPHFRCGDVLTNDSQLLLTIRAIGGLPIENLTEEEKEIAAKALECGYLQKSEGVLEPKIVVIEGKDWEHFLELGFSLCEGMDEIAQKAAEELAGYIKKHLPKHLLEDYQEYIRVSSARTRSQIFEALVKDGILEVPADRIGAEGVVMIVEK